MNIFTTENIAKYNTKGATSGVGEYVLRNGVWTMNIKPAPFYQNFGTSSYILKDEFVANTQYIIDFWIDTDDVIYNDKNIIGGIRLWYTDDTKNESAMVIGGNKGFQHIRYVTDITKSVSRLQVYYGTNSPVYYRADSRVVPLSNQSNVYKTGIAYSTEFTEYVNGLDNAKIGKGYMLSNQFYEL